MKCTFDTGSPVAVVTVTGDLDLAGTSVLRGAIMKCLAAQPQAVVIDANGLVVTDDIHLTTFAAAARSAAAWPSVPVMLCAPPPTLAAVRRLGIDRHVVVCSSVDDGRRRAARRTLPPRVSGSYAPLPESVPRARAFVVDACHAWQLPDTAPVAEMVTAELVSNAVRHAGTRLDLVVSRTTRHVTIAVRDGCPEPARLVGPDSTAPHGRGLILVDTLASHWGCTPTADGKVTWAAVPAVSKG